MEEYRTHKIFRSNRDLNQKEIERMKQVCSQILGLIEFQVDLNSISIEYYSHLQSYETIKDVLEKAGFHILKAPKKGFFNRFLKKLAKDNKDAFGGKPLDCCDLNK